MRSPDAALAPRTSALPAESRLRPAWATHGLGGDAAAAAALQAHDIYLATPGTVRVWSYFALLRIDARPLAATAPGAPPQSLLAPYADADEVPTWLGGSCDIEPQRRRLAALPVPPWVAVQGESERVAGALQTGGRRHATAAPPPRQAPDITVRCVALPETLDNAVEQRRALELGEDLVSGMIAVAAVGPFYVACGDGDSPAEDWHRASAAAWAFARLWRAVAAADERAAVCRARCTRPEPSPVDTPPPPALPAGACPQVARAGGCEFSVAAAGCELADWLAKRARMPLPAPVLVPPQPDAAEPVAAMIARLVDAAPTRRAGVGPRRLRASLAALAGVPDHLFQVLKKSAWLNGTRSQAPGLSAGTPGPPRARVRAHCSAASAPRPLSLAPMMQGEPPPPPMRERAPATEPED